VSSTQENEFLEGEVSGSNGDKHEEDCLMGCHSLLSGRS
jgi:hypothetical protein